MIRPLPADLTKLWAVECARSTINVNTKTVKNVWENCIETFTSPKMAKWQGVFDPVYGTVFFFNTEVRRNNLAEI